MVSSLQSLHFNDFPKLYFDSIKCSHAFVLKLWIFQRCSQFKQISFHRLFVASYFWCPCLSGPWEDTGRDRYAHSLGVFWPPGVDIMFSFFTSHHCGTHWMPMFLNVPGSFLKEWAGDVLLCCHVKRWFQAYIGNWDWKDAFLNKEGLGECLVLASCILEILG